MTTIEYRIGADADDGYWYGTTFDNDDIQVGKNFMGVVCSCFARWTGVTIPAGATITVAYVTYNATGGNGTPSGCTIYFDDSASPTAPTTASQANAKTKTTNYVSYSPSTSGTLNTSSLVSIIQELVDTYDYSAGAPMQMLWIGGGSSKTWADIKNYGDYPPATSMMLLHIEFSAAASGSLVIPSHRRRLNALLVR